ncbi:MAG: methyltransferase domain-containing protein [Lachnospiraceae bacterium]|nr:methyltransferase domain-containing protein [Lachnospiraceae bacterium]
MEKKYGKSFGKLNSFKTNFFEDNDGMLKMADEMADIFASQPKRKVCKICGTPLLRPLFVSHRLGYIQCPECGHLNGEYEDTDEFASKVYVEDDYSRNYSEDTREKYQNRMNLIYIPKAEYLKTCLEKEGVKDINILDIGAGCGYFVTAARTLGMKAHGIEVSKNEVDHGNRMAGEEILVHVGLKDSIEYIKNTDANTISAIGVLEHLIHLKENLEAVRENDNIRYLYASVPMFSFSCAFEASHQDCYNRHCGGTHTHLFTNSSIERMASDMGFEVAYEWRFGSDINDLYRFIMVSLAKNKNEDFAAYFSQKFTPLMDDLQLILDKSEFSSELHFILKRR